MHLHCGGKKMSGTNLMKRVTYLMAMVLCVVVALMGPAQASIPAGIAQLCPMQQPERCPPGFSKHVRIFNLPINVELLEAKLERYRFRGSICVGVANPGAVTRPENGQGAFGKCFELKVSH